MIRFLEATLIISVILYLVNIIFFDLPTSRTQYCENNPTVQYCAE